MSTPTNTIRLHRVLKATPEKVYRALLDADALGKWISPNGYTCKVHQHDPKVGGTYRMSFTNFTNGKSHSFGGTYLKLVPGKKLRYTDKFDDPNLPGEIQVTIILKKVSVGTEVNIEQAGVPAIIPPEMCYLGWQESLINLAMLIEPDIPNGPASRGFGTGYYIFDCNLVLDLPCENRHRSRLPVKTAPF